MTATVDGQSQTIKGVAWELDGTYKQKDERQTLTFTAKLPDGYKLADNVSLPKITVIVNAKATVIKEIGAFSFSFETLDFAIGTAEWIIRSYLPDYLTATVDGTENQTISSVTWENYETAYDEQSSEPQTITYTAKLPDGYRLADGVALPEIIVITSPSVYDDGEYTITYASWNTSWEFGYAESLRPNRYSGDEDVLLPVPIPLIEESSSFKFIFVGWYTANTEDGSLNLDEKITKIEKGSSGDKIFYALYGLSNPLIYYDDKKELAGLEPDAYCCELGTTLPVLTETKPDHTFEGWCKNDSTIFGTAYDIACDVDWDTVITEIEIMDKYTYPKPKYLCAKWKWDKEEEVLATINSFTSAGSPNELKITGELTIADVKTIGDALKKLDESIQVKLDLSECTGLTDLGHCAFGYWSDHDDNWNPRSNASLVEIILPEGLTSVSKNAFAHCPNLERVTLPNSITEISNNAFDGCKALTTIELPDSVTRIGQGAFHDCESLKTVRLPNYITTIEEKTFMDCHALESIIIPDSVTEIGRSAFSDCSALPAINIPDSITKIASAAFASCTSLQSIDIPESVTEIGISAFYNCESLSSIKIPSKVTKIEDNTFWFCTALKSVTIPDSITEIGYQAFTSCHALESIDIPDSVTKIGYRAFCFCETLKTITIEAETPPELGYQALDDIADAAKIYVPSGSVEAYKKHEAEVNDPWTGAVIFGWKNYADKIQAKP